MWTMLGITSLPLIGGGLARYAVRHEVSDWYPTLKKPWWQPPPQAFPYVWTSLYTAMGYGSYLVYEELGGFTEDAVVPLGLYGLQLALNWSWPLLFFGAHKLKWAFVDVILVAVTAVATMVSWYPISRTALLLMVPYVSWLGILTSLNYCIWRDNPEKKNK
ncbi:unnamed protein product [Tetraodon nigroviridis]|uniref:Chromosome 11 SCAF14979, whole genome shotgun sequence n=1 Tax=Tetraodon nigroviridis TaxID=99883 RepID=Q4RXF9_TETNG|nr:unnamed protein product [Tetraodon nigroviridis]